MGKSFRSELALLNATFEWACKANIDELARQIALSKSTPLVTVGSGGSLSSCYFACNLHQATGKLAKAMTPLELLSSKSVINAASLLFLSAGGKNTDILTCFKNSIKEEPIRLIALVLSLNSPLKKLTEEYTASQVVDYKNPAGKDGFLATNSLLAFFVLLYRGYNLGPIPTDLNITQGFHNEIRGFLAKINRNFTYQVLFDYISQPVAIDIESKFSEAALGNVIYADYRNFGHGRHHWLAKRAENTCLIALITPDIKDLAEKTLKLIPPNIPILRIESKTQGLFAAIQLLVKSFYLANAVGEMQQLDPGKPGVPEFGRKLYHLKYSSVLKKDVNENLKVAIQRKLNDKSFYSLNEEEINKWSTAYTEYKKKISQTAFGGIIFDYDGTLCESKNRFTGISDEMALLLNKLLHNKILVGIATGRGKSIRADLQKVIDLKYQSNLFIGYYNGGEIGELANNDIPKIITNEHVHKALKDLNKLLSKRFPELKPEAKKFQLTIEFNRSLNVDIKNEVVEFVRTISTGNILCVESTHSIDLIVKPEVSKLNVVRYCSQLLAGTKYEEILCIGDKGRFPGNDFELLSHKLSLSVDETSSDISTCWNFSPPGLRQIDSTLFYMNNIGLHKNHFTMNL